MTMTSNVQMAAGNGQNQASSAGFFGSPADAFFALLTGHLTETAENLSTPPLNMGDFSTDTLLNDSGEEQINVTKDGKYDFNELLAALGLDLKSLNIDPSTANFGEVRQKLLNSIADPDTGLLPEYKPMLQQGIENSEGRTKGMLNALLNSLKNGEALNGQIQKHANGQETLVGQTQSATPPAASSEAGTVTDGDPIVTTKEAVTPIKTTETAAPTPTTKPSEATQKFAENLSANIDRPVHVKIATQTEAQTQQAAAETVQETVQKTSQEASKPLETATDISTKTQTSQETIVPKEQKKTSETVKTVPNQQTAAAASTTTETSVQSHDTASIDTALASKSYKDGVIEENAERYARRDEVNIASSATSSSQASTSPSKTIENGTATTTSIVDQNPTTGLTNKTVAADPLAADAQSDFEAYLAQQQSAGKDDFHPIFGRMAQDGVSANDAARQAASAQQFRPAFMQTPVEQVSVQVKQAVESGLDQIKIHLKPVDLGAIDISMELTEDGKLSALIRAEKPETLDLLRNDRSLLEKALADSGFDTGSDGLNFSLNDQSSQDQAQSGQENGSDGLAFNEAISADDETGTDVASDIPEDIAVEILPDGTVVTDGLDIKV